MSPRYHNTPTRDFVREQMRLTGQKRTTIYMRLKAGWYPKLVWSQFKRNESSVTGDGEMVRP